MPRRASGATPSPGCGLGTLLQRLTIDAASEADLGMRLNAARAGSAAEDLTLVLPSVPSALAVLGPRITGQITCGGWLPGGDHQAAISAVVARGCGDGRLP